MFGEGLKATSEFLSSTSLKINGKYSLKALKFKCLKYTVKNIVNVYMHILYIHEIIFLLVCVSTLDITINIRLKFQASAGLGEKQNDGEAMGINGIQ